MLQSAISSAPGTSYDSARMCYLSPVAAGAASDEARIRSIIKNIKDVREAKIEIRSQSESCLCYGYTEEEDPMTRYQRVLREAGADKA